LASPAARAALREEVQCRSKLDQPEAVTVQVLTAAEDADFGRMVDAAAWNVFLMLRQREAHPRILGPPYVVTEVKQATVWG
jgi:hypothetical protein